MNCIQFGFCIDILFNVGYSFIAVHGMFFRYILLDTSESKISLFNV